MNATPKSSLGFFAHLVRGCGTLPHCGEHPGTVFLWATVLMGAAAGAKRGGWIGAIAGAGVMLAGFGLIYQCGAYDRSKAEERSNQRDVAIRPPAKISCDRCGGTGFLWEGSGDCGPPNFCPACDGESDGITEKRQSTPNAK